MSWSTSGGRPGRATGAVVSTWAVALAVSMLGPALGRGLVLSYDMVWVPDLALRSDFTGTGSGVPRAVPSDAVVAVLDEVVPGELLQKLILLGVLVCAGLGMAALVGPHRRLTVRLLAVGLGSWNPFVAERLALGQWPVLVGYAVLPWLVVAARRWRTSGRLPWWLPVVVVLGSLSASAGLATALALVALAADRARWWVVGVLVAGANAPWVIAGLLHAGIAGADPAGARVFALSAEGGVPGPLAALTLGGIWNSEVVPASRLGATGWLALVVLMGLAAVGATAWWRDRGDRGDRGGRGAWSREAVALVVCWIAGWGWASLTWLAPGMVGALGALVPGAAVSRDGARVLVLCAPVLVLAVCRGAEGLLGRVPRVLPARVGAATAAVLLPVALLPDAAWGLSGRLAGVDYPPAYAEARAVVAARHDRTGGDVLLLPSASYRQPRWNGLRKVLDPTGRYLTPDFVADDRLVVDGIVLRGEDPRAERARAALALDTPRARARALAADGVATVVVDREAPGRVPQVGGAVLVDRAPLLVVAVDDPRPRRPPSWWVAAMALAWTAWAGALLSSVPALARARARAGPPGSRRRRRGLV